MKREDYLQARLTKAKKSMKQQEARIAMEKSKLALLKNKARTRRLIQEGAELEGAVGRPLTIEQIYSLVSAAFENGWTIDVTE